MVQEGAVCATCNDSLLDVAALPRAPLADAAPAESSARLLVVDRCDCVTCDCSARARSSVVERSGSGAAAAAAAGCRSYDELLDDSLGSGAAAAAVEVMLTFESDGSFGGVEFASAEPPAWWPLVCEALRAKMSEVVPLVNQRVVALDRERHVVTFHADLCVNNCRIECTLLPRRTNVVIMCSYVGESRCRCRVCFGMVEIPQLAPQPRTLVDKRVSSDRLRILVVDSEPLTCENASMAPLRRGLESEVIRKAAGLCRSKIDVRVVVNATIGALLELLADSGGWDIVHVSAHGRENRALYLQDECGRAVAIEGDTALSHFFLQARCHVQLVVLSACYSRMHGESLVSHGVARSVLCCDRSVSVEGSAEFFSHFYGMMCSGSSASRALEVSVLGLQVSESWNEFKSTFDLVGARDTSFAFVTSVANNPLIEEMSERVVSVPQVAPSFIGRNVLMSSAIEAILSPGNRALVLRGAVGVGKTELAKAVAWWMHYHEQYDFVGFLSVCDEMNDVLHVLHGVPVEPMETRIARLADLRSTIATRRRLLFVLDRFDVMFPEEADVQRFWNIMNSLPAKCQFVCTSRRAVRTAPGVAELPVTPLDVADCVRIFWLELQRSGFFRSRSTVSEGDLVVMRAIAEQCGGNPLALSLCSQYCARHSLHECQAMLHVDASAVLRRTVFDRQGGLIPALRETLDALAVSTRQVFLLCCALYQPDVDALADVLGSLPFREVDELASLHLVERSGRIVAVPEWARQFGCAQLVNSVASAESMRWLEVAVSRLGLVEPSHVVGCACALYPLLVAALACEMLQLHTERLRGMAALTHSVLAVALVEDFSHAGFAILRSFLLLCPRSASVHDDAARLLAQAYVCLCHYERLESKSVAAVLAEAVQLTQRASAAGEADVVVNLLSASALLAATLREEAAAADYCNEALAWTKNMTNTTSPNSLVAVACAYASAATLLRRSAPSAHAQMTANALSLFANAQMQDEPPRIERLVRGALAEAQRAAELCAAHVALFANDCCCVCLSFRAFALLGQRVGVREGVSLLSSALRRLLDAGAYSRVQHVVAIVQDALYDVEAPDSMLVVVRKWLDVLAVSEDSDVRSLIHAIVDLLSTRELSVAAVEGVLSSVPQSVTVTASGSSTTATSSS